MEDVEIRHTSHGKASQRGVNGSASLTSSATGHQQARARNAPRASAGSSCRP
eukprot:CAMPEP_0115093774 /NCGR_PEP_ID=MMETSP0227-20121206/27824_1 /TAXON_ID=89957 /ORGANISM="Polarella glacialis, Strain CCMP 1383" /LENGTH=51 /DNA_ID=CAMNT_0002486373 /DNA_START=1 /DNA_END=153 /DNA_ORIENTATION=+